MKYVRITLTLTILAAAGHVRAQPPRQDADTGSAPTAVKVGVVDVGVLFRQQERVKILKADLDRRVKPFEDKREELGKLITDWTKALRDPAGKLSEAEREKGKEVIFECKRQREDLDKLCRKEIGEHLGAEMIALDKEIRQTIKVYAEAHGYHLILAYGESETELPPLADMQRRMTAIDSGNISFILPGAAGSLDVTRGVLDLLNSSFRAGNGLPR